MNRPTVTDQNLYLLLPSKISKMAVWYAKDFGVSVIEAMRHIYQSATYKELASAETRLWHYGPVALYEHLVEKDLMITPELQKRIDEARRELAEGKTRHFSNAADMRKWLDEVLDK